MERYDVDADTWSFVDPLPTGDHPTLTTTLILILALALNLILILLGPRMGHASVVIDDTIITMGGSTGGNQP